ncbi:MAG: hypothetical protein AB8F74_10205 [Saprospiraceae bacterium]
MLPNRARGFLLKPNLILFLLTALFTSSQAEVEYIIPLNAKEHKIGNMLEWTTSSEINSHNFVIEKSLDGVDFIDIGLLDAAGMSGEKKGYRFLDMDMNNDRALYRLKQVDLDGRQNYSQTVLLNRLIPNQFSVVAMSRTSFDKTFEVTLDIIADVTMEIKITDLEGNIIQERKEQIEYGLNDIKLDFTDEPIGIYKIAILVKDEEEFLVVQKTDEGEEMPNPVASSRKQTGG